MPTPRALDVARNQFGRLVWTHKVHEKEREIWSKKVTATKWANVILTGATTLSALAAAYCPARWIDITTAVLGAIATAFLIYQISFDPAKQESDHRHMAKRLLVLRERYILLIQKMMDRPADMVEHQEVLDRLSEELATVYEFAPATSPEALAAAAKALKVDGDFTSSQEEIDNFLPEALRIANG